jgi:hypothetical protein
MKCNELQGQESLDLISFYNNAIYVLASVIRLCHLSIYVAVLGLLEGIFRKIW